MISIMETKKINEFMKKSRIISSLGNLIFIGIAIFFFWLAFYENNAMIDGLARMSAFMAWTYAFWKLVFKDKERHL